MLKFGIILYLVFINIVTILVWRADKRAAQRGEWRWRESVLFVLAVIGGSIGAVIAMHALRHKTRKAAFRIGLPLILILQLAAAVFLYLYLTGALEGLPQIG